MGQVFRSWTQAATSRGARSGPAERQDIGRRGRSEPDDDQGGVVGGAVGREQIEQDGVGKGFGVDVLVADEGVGEAVEADVDVLAAAFDQAVRVQDEGLPGGEDGGALGPGNEVRLGAERGSVAWSRNSTAPSVCSSAGGGCPALL